MERLLLKLVFEILKLLLQLVLWAVTGTWHRFGKKGEQAKAEAAPQAAAKPKKKRSKKTKPEPVRGRFEAGRSDQTAREQSKAPWAFQFADELTEREPQSEEEAIAQEDLRVLRRKRARNKLQVPAAPSAPRSLQSALRDRRTVREALLLGAALAPRDRRS